MRLFVLTLFFLLCPLLFASSGSESTFSPNLGEGHWNLATSSELTKHQGRNNDATEFSLYLSPRYFVMDRVGAGLTFGLDQSSEDPLVASLGPSLQWFFWNQERIASYLGATFRMGLTDATVSSMITGTAGIDFFLAPTVAIGPSLYFSHFNSRRSINFQRYGMLVSLGVFI